MDDSRRNRTWLASVLFADVAGFSERPVGEQGRIKECFNAVIGAAIERVAEEDRIVVDTGDGLAVCFFGDPEDALLVALAVRDELPRCAQGDPPYTVRLGLNLGPVKIVTDINGRTNAIGDGMNVAQRVMTFADPGQLLCSRSYFEVVSRISADYETMFRFCGVRHDKHVREHSLYEIGPPSPMPPALEVPPRAAWSEEECAAVAAVLGRYAGPLAPVLVRRASRSSASPEEALELVASEVEPGSAREAFLAEARAALSR